MNTDNDALAEKLRRAADLREKQGANRKTAHTAETSGTDLRVMYDRGGREQLEDFPGIGQSLSAAHDSRPDPIRGIGEGSLRSGLAMLARGGEPECRVRYRQAVAKCRHEQ